MNYPIGTKLTVGTYNDNAYSILIRERATPLSDDADFAAEVTVADAASGEVIDQFEESGGTDWALRNACIKRIITEDYS